jgi:uncharacterized membrane protein
MHIYLLVCLLLIYLLFIYLFISGLIRISVICTPQNFSAFKSSKVRWVRNVARRDYKPREGVCEETLGKESTWKT